jgi:hypothetical protein
MQAKQQKDERERLAHRYVCWMDPDAALRDPPRLLCQIMTFGTARDYVAARREWGEGAFKDALRTARPGALDERSWVFWHRQFELPPCALPKRHFDDALS